MIMDNVFCVSLSSKYYNEKNDKTENLRKIAFGLLICDIATRQCGFKSSEI